MTRELAKEIIASLLKYGYLFKVFAGIQIDLAPVWAFLKDNDGSQGGNWREITYCPLNCRIDGGGEYDCFAAAFAPQNAGIKSGFAKFETVLRWIVLSADAMYKMREMYFQSAQYNEFCQKFGIGEELKLAITEHMMECKLEINLFGGSPEMIPWVLRLIKELKAMGYIVNLTSTGRQIVVSKQFREALALKENQPDAMFLSIDDITNASLQTWAQLDFAGIQELLKKVERDEKQKKHGQLIKAISAMGVLKLKKEQPDALPMLGINNVVHAGNIHLIPGLLYFMREKHPGVVVNPYLAQTSFEGTHHIWNEDQIKAHANWVAQMRLMHKIEHSVITKRMQYYDAAAAIIQLFGDKPQVCGDMLNGWGFWQCFRNWPIFYLQISRGPTNIVQIGKRDQKPQTDPGGHCGCVWHNESITQQAQIGSVDQVVDFVSGGAMKIAAETGGPCNDCDMPRLMLHFIATWIGLNPKFLPKAVEFSNEVIPWDLKVA